LVPVPGVRLGRKPDVRTRFLRELAEIASFSTRAESIEISDRTLKPAFPG